MKKKKGIEWMDSGNQRASFEYTSSLFRVWFPVSEEPVFQQADSCPHMFSLSTTFSAFPSVPAFLHGQQQRTHRFCWDKSHHPSSDDRYFYFMEEETWSSRVLNICRGTLCGEKYHTSSSWKPPDVLIQKCGALPPLHSVPECIWKLSQI